MNSKILLTANFHLIKTLDGEFFSPAIYDMTFFNRYINVFGELWIFAKTKKVKSVQNELSDYFKIDTKTLNIIELPWYQGSIGFLINFIPMVVKISKYRKRFDGYILRVAQLESYLVYFILGLKKNRYLVEVVNDPAQILKYKIPNSLNLFIFKSILLNAMGISYVTKQYLQRKYSPLLNTSSKNNVLETYYSSVEISDEHILLPRKYTSNPKQIRIIHVSNTMKDNIKGHITTIKIVKMLVDNGFNVQCVFVGHGSSIDKYEALVNELGITDYIHFIGRVTNKDKIFQYIDDSNLFLYPTNFDGLPRVLIEAMARGIPVISSPVSGVPELLDPQFLIEPNNIEGFYKLIASIFSNYQMMNYMSETNIKKAREFSSEVLKIRRTEFLEYLRK